MDVQVFGTKGDADTRKALRFFSERRVRTHFVDLRKRPASKGELRRFIERFGSDAVIDRDADQFRTLGLHAAHYGPDRWLEILEEEPALLRTPLVRWKQHVTVGLAEESWREWVQSG